MKPTHRPHLARGLTILISRRSAAALPRSLPPLGGYTSPKVPRELQEHLRPKGPGSPAGRGGRRTSFAPRAGPLVADGAGRRLHHRGGHLRRHRPGCGFGRRAGRDPLLCHRRRGLRPGRPVLCRVRRHGPRGRQRLHLCLHHAGRNLRLDHRLGPDPGIRHGLRHGGLGLDELLQQVAGGARVSRRFPPRCPTILLSAAESSICPRS